MSEMYGTLTQSANAVTSLAEPEKTIRAAIYARTSSVSQKLGYSLGEQVRLCVERAHMLGWEVRYVFRDENKSGKDTDRPMFQQMLSLAEAGYFDVLVFWKLDRFSRTIMDAVELEKQFFEWDVALHSVTEQLDTTTPAGRFNFRNIANAAEFERELIKQRTKMGHIARAMEYKWPNSMPPLGYSTRDDGRLEIDASEADLVRRIFKMYLKERSMVTVAETLNQEGLVGRRRTDWTSSSVRTVLRNKLYIGKYSVGEVEAQVEEYQILSRDLFRDATSVRTRFQSSEPAERPPMAKQIKELAVERIIEQYLDYLG